MLKKLGGGKNSGVKIQRLEQMSVCGDASAFTRSVPSGQSFPVDPQWAHDSPVVTGQCVVAHSSQQHWITC